MAKKHVAICTDYDGCLIEALKNHEDPYKELVLEPVVETTFKPRFNCFPCCFRQKVIHNTVGPHHLIQHASVNIRRHHPDTVTVMNFSNRQDFGTDVFNQRGIKGSVATGTSIFAQQLRDANPLIQNFYLDKKLLADVASYGKEWNFPAGTTWDGMMHAVEKQNIPHPGCTSLYFFETHKRLLTYMQAHRLAARFPTDEIHMYVYDDRKDILNAIFSTFNHFSHYLPRNLTLYLQTYDGSGASLATPPLRISGTGEIDVNHDETYRQYCDTLICNYFNSMVAKKPQQIPANAPRGETLFEYLCRIGGAKIGFEHPTFDKIKAQPSALAQTSNIIMGIEDLTQRRQEVQAVALAAAGADAVLTTERSPLLV